MANSKNGVSTFRPAISLVDILEQHKGAMTSYERYLLTLRPGSLPSVKSTMTILSQMIFQCPSPHDAPWHTITIEILHMVARYLRGNGYKPKTCLRYMSFLRSILTQCWKDKLIDDRTYHLLKAEKIRFGSIVTKGRAIDIDEEIELNSTTREDDRALGARDLAMFALMRYCGLRREEVVRIQMDDLKMNGIGHVLVNGKADKQRLAPMPPGVKEIITDWLAFRGHEPGPLITSLTKGMKIRRTPTGDVRQMDVSSVNKALKKRAILSGVENVTPHDLRRTFATRRLENGTNLKTVQDLMGHGSITTTAIYTRISQKLLDASANQDEVM